MLMRLGVPIWAENTPFEPDPAATGVGKHVSLALNTFSINR